MRTIRTWAMAAALERGWKRRRGEPALGEVKSFLLLQHAAALGTVVHTTPLLAALHESVPGCRIVVVASGLSREIYLDDPLVEAVFQTPSPMRDLPGALRTMRRLRPFGGEAFCTLIPLGNERTTVLLQAVASAGWMRVGFSIVPGMMTVALAYDVGLSQIANNLRIVTALGHALRPHEPHISFSEQDVAFARGLLLASGWAPGQVVALFVTQTSVTQRKRWRPERFRAAAQFVQERAGAYVVFVGTASEAAAIDALREGLAFPTANLAGQTNLKQLAALLSLGSVGLTLDTGTMHVGRAVGLPMVIVAPAWSPPLEWLPLGDARFRVLKNLDMDTAPEGYLIDEVSVEEVTAALGDLMDRFGQRSAP